MKKYLLEDDKEILNFKRKVSLLEGILLILMCIATYEYDRSLSTVTLLYSFPIMVIVISIENLVILDNYRKLDMKYFLSSLILSVLLLIIPTYIVITKNINPNSFMILLGITIIVRNVISYLIYNNRKISLIKNIILVILGLLIIVFNEFIVSNLVLYLIIVFAIIAILKIGYYIITKK